MRLNDGSMSLLNHSQRKMQGSRPSSAAEIPPLGECRSSVLNNKLILIELDFASGGPVDKQVQRISLLHTAAFLCDRFYQDESGQDLIEYALLAALVASAAISGTQNLANSVANEMSTIASAFTNAIPQSAGSGNNNGTNGSGGNRRGRRGGGSGGGRRGRHG